MKKPKGFDESQKVEAVPTRRVYVRREEKYYIGCESGGSLYPYPQYVSLERDEAVQVLLELQEALSGKA